MRHIIATLFVIALVAACGLTTINHEVDPDAMPDADVGSGSAAGEMEPSPRDNGLELVVVGASLFVAIAPVGAIRRRRREAKDAKPHFS